MIAQELDSKIRELGPARTPSPCLRPDVDGRLDACLERDDLEGRVQAASPQLLDPQKSDRRRGRLLAGSDRGLSRDALRTSRASGALWTCHPLWPLRAHRTSRSHGTGRSHGTCHSRRPGGSLRTRRAYRTFRTLQTLWAFWTNGTFRSLRSIGRARWAYWPRGALQTLLPTLAGRSLRTRRANLTLFAFRANWPLLSILPQAPGARGEHEAQREDTDKRSGHHELQPGRPTTCDMQYVDCSGPGLETRIIRRCVLESRLHSQTRRLFDCEALASFSRSASSQASGTPVTPSSRSGATASP